MRSAITSTSIHGFFSIWRWNARRRAHELDRLAQDRRRRLARAPALLGMRGRDHLCERGVRGLGRRAQIGDQLLLLRRRTPLELDRGEPQDLDLVAKLVRPAANELCGRSRVFGPRE
jgi:hypothetical protein